MIEVEKPAMQEWQKRVVEEKAELDERIEKLEAFIASPKFEVISTYHAVALKDQAAVMRRYSEILGRRIAMFERTAMFEAGL